MTRIVLELEDAQWAIKVLKIAADDFEIGVARGQAFPGRHIYRQIADQIEAQTKPPKPDEPQGLGAVVEDSSDRRWTRTRSHEHGLNWRSEWAGMWKTYADIAAVKVLSEGVTQ